MHGDGDAVCLTAFFNCAQFLSKKKSHNHLGVGLNESRETKEAYYHHHTLIPSPNKQTCKSQ